MIDMVFGPGVKISVKGHAGFAEKGKDIVCAGVSALFFTFLESTGAQMKKNGDVICAEADPDYKNRAVFDAIYKGCKLISDEYPENVRIYCPTETDP